MCSFCPVYCCRFHPDLLILDVHFRHLYLKSLGWVVYGLASGGMRVREENTELASGAFPQTLPSGYTFVQGV